MQKSTVIKVALAIGLAAITTLAQDPAGQPPPGDRPFPPDGAGNPRPPGPGFRPPMSPLEQVLDADHDVIISAEEIANAPAALIKLDKNGDGKLTPDEFRPFRRGPGRPPGGPDDQQGPGPGFDRDGQGPGNPGPGNGPRRRPAGE